LIVTTFAVTPIPLRARRISYFGGVRCRDRDRPRSAASSSTTSRGADLLRQPADRLDRARRLPGVPARTSTERHAIDFAGALAGALSSIVLFTSLGGRGRIHGDRLAIVPASCRRSFRVACSRADHPACSSATAVLKRVGDRRVRTSAITGLPLYFQITMSPTKSPATDAADGSAWTRSAGSWLGLRSAGRIP
jgi:hypothetical protein